MESGSDYFRRRAIKTLAAELTSEARVRLRAEAHGQSLKQQLDAITAELMLSWAEPEIIAAQSQREATYNAAKGREDAYLRAAHFELARILAAASAESVL